MTAQTIFALSSAKGKAGVSIFRISGKKSLDILNHITGNLHQNIVPRLLGKSKIFDPETSELIDEAMVVYFKSPHSFTGEDIVEIHTHGSIAISKLLTQVVLRFENTRYAESGEFTRRAVLNGKMDLTSAEGLMDLINSETLMQHKQSIKQMCGLLYQECEHWRTEIISIMSLIEAFIDFPDEEIPEEIIQNAEDKICSIKSSFFRYLNDERRGERLRNGLKLTIYGKPNVGKSSLMNFLSQKEVAIVSSISGTTRDIIETHLDIGGYPIILTDTAGIHEESSGDPIEQEGIRRAKIAINEADIKIHLQDSADFAKPASYEKSIIYVVNKIDLVDFIPLENVIPISIKRNLGLEKLLEIISEKASKLAGNGQDIYITQTRHRSALQNSYNALERLNLRSDIIISNTLAFAKCEYKTQFFY